MPFAASSRNICLVADTTLSAECQAPNGAWVDATLGLERLLGNVAGAFEWLGSEFHKDATKIRLEGTVLHAQLPTAPEGQHQAASVELDERICNVDGELAYVDTNLGFVSPLGRRNEKMIPPEFFSHRGCSAGHLCEHLQWARDTHEREIRRVMSEKGLSALPSFEYSPLPSPTAFRLLEIKEAESPSDLVQCSLIVVEPQQKKIYDALSYTWGNPFEDNKLDEFYNKQVSILCNGQHLRVGRNLFEALRSLRRVSKKQEIRGEYSKTRIIVAAEQGLESEVQRLLSQGADFRARDSFGQTALHRAVENGHLETVKILVHAGSPLATRDKLNERTPMDCAKERLNEGGVYVKIVEFLETQEKHNFQSILESLKPRTWSSTEPKLIWIDALCINQTDDEEKQKQVAHMNKIYGSARKAIVWLGREKKDIDDETVEKMLAGTWKLELAGYTNKKDKESKTSVLQSPREQLSPDRQSKLHDIMQDWLKSMDEEDVKRWMTGVPLFRRRWFERAWVMQEIILARDAVVLCGPFSLSWDVMVLMSCILQSCILTMREGNKQSDRQPWISNDEYLYRSLMLHSEGFEIGAMIPVLALERKRRAYWNKSLPGIDALQMSRNARATDAKDKVFAMFSITPPMKFTVPRRNVERPIKVRRIVPNYKQTIHDLYVNTSRFLLETYGIEVLSLVRHEESSGFLEMPSWVVDLRVALDYRSLGARNLSSQVQVGLHKSVEQTAESPQLFTIQPNNRLRIQAAKLHEIEDVSELAGVGNIGPDFTRVLDWIRLLKSFSMESVPEVRQRLWTTLVCYGERKSAQEFDDSFIAWIQVQSIFQLLGHKPHSATDLAALQDIEELLKPQRSDIAISRLLKVMEDMNAALGITATTEFYNQHQVWKDLSQGHFSRHFAYFNALSSRANMFGRALHKRDLSRRIFLTHEGIGAGPKLTRPGDQIFLIRGASVPYILRPAGDRKFRLIGEAYIRGMLRCEDRLLESTDALQELLII